MTGSVFTHVVHVRCYGCVVPIWGVEQAEAHAAATGHHVEVEVLTRTHFNEDAMAPDVAAAVGRARDAWQASAAEARLREAETAS